MSGLLRAILGVKDLDPADPSVRLEFAHPFPAWAWVFAIMGCVAFAAWSYWRLLGRRSGRVWCAAMRAMLLALVLVIISGPRLVRQTQRTEKDWVVLMLDRSGSMTIADAPEHATREDQLRKTLQDAAPALGEIADQRNLLVVGFDAGVYEVPASKPAGPVPLHVPLSDPKGARTLLGRSLEQLLRRVAARPVAGVVVLSDGRSADGVPKGVLKTLESRQIPVFAVPLGSEEGVPDLAVTRVEAPSAAFVNDTVPVSVEVRALGLSAGATPPRGNVEVVDKATGRVLDSRALPEKPEGEAWRVTLTAPADSAGTRTWIARVVPEKQDLTPGNNAEEFAVELVSRPVRVVYFDGYPRWEYRYLKNLLIREKSVRSSAMVLASERRYIQEGSEPLDTLPRTPQAWSGIDVIVLGDLRPELFSDEQLSQIREHVSRDGAGLLWIGGPGATPAAWRGTPLADLLPVVLRSAGADAADSGPREWLKPVVIAPAPAAERLGVLRLGESTDQPWPAYLSDPSARWPVLRWAQRLERSMLKPTAEVLARALPVGADEAIESGDDVPMVLTMRYGAGRVVYVGTDEIWRYRYARGEALPERFYIPLIRLLARETLGRSGKPAVIEVSPTTALVDQQVQVSVRLVDQNLLERRPASMLVRVTPRDGAPNQGVDLELRPEGAGDPEAASGVFSGRFVTSDPGPYIAAAADPLLTGLDLSASFMIVLPDDEMRRPQADHATLASLAATTGGATLQPGELSKLPALLPNRELSILASPDIETLWDKWAVWVVLLLLATTEWIVRRLIKLS